MDVHPHADACGGAPARTPLRRLRVARSTRRVILSPVGQPGRVLKRARIEPPVLTEQLLDVTLGMGMPAGALRPLWADIMGMDHMNGERAIRERYNTPRVGTPHKPGIHTHLNVSEPMRSPKRFEITEFATQQPYVLARRIDVFVRASGLQVVV